jgi:hypothetical protein
MHSIGVEIVIRRHRGMIERGEIVAILLRSRFTAEYEARRSARRRCCEEKSREAPADTVAVLHVMR